MNAPGGAPPWLALLLTGLCGRPMRVQPFTTEPVDARPVLTTGHLLVTATCVEPANAGDAHAALGRAVVAHAAAHLLHSTPGQPTAGLKPASVAVIGALEDARVERLAMRRSPGLRRWWAPYHARVDAEAVADDLTFDAFVSRLARVLFDPAARDGNHWVDKGRGLFEVQAALDLDDVAAFRAIGSVLANDLGQMRVRFEPQQYRVAPAYRDDNTFLWCFPERADTPPPDAQSLDALPERATLTLREARASEAGDVEPAPEEIELARYLLPEWDRRLERHRRDWCTAVDTIALAPARALPTSAALPPPVTRPARARLSRARQLRRQFEGDTLDLDAAVEVLVDRRLGLAPDPRLFRRPGREIPPVSLLVLLDLSASANDACESDGTRTTILALEREAALALVRQRRDDGSRVAVHGFRSNTRSHVTYLRLIDFGMSFDARAAGRLAAARARHSTRMGAALRRATTLLAGEHGTRRHLLVVTDGAPSDVDVFDPRYLVEDARMAVLEARRAGVHVQCLTLDANGAATAKRIFGWRDYRVVTHHRALASELRHVMERAAMA